jgi:hypothetical protein
MINVQARLYCRQTIRYVLCMQETRLYNVSSVSRILLPRGFRGKREPRFAGPILRVAVGAGEYRTVWWRPSEHHFDGAFGRRRQRYVPYDITTNRRCCYHGTNQSDDIITFSSKLFFTNNWRVISRNPVFVFQNAQRIFIKCGMKESKM